MVHTQLLKMSSTETGELHTLAIESAHIDWTVPDLSQQLEKLEVGEALMSPSFTASPEGRLRWYLKLKFNSSRAKRDGLVGLFLAREPIERKVDVKVEFRAAVVDAKGRKSEERNFLKNFTNEAPNDWGWHHYLQIGAAALVGPDTVKFRVQLELDSHKVTGDYYSVAPVSH